MFTGIVQAVGTIVRVKPFEVDCGALDRLDLRVGDSICVQGACLTVTGLTASGFTADLSSETLQVTCGLDRPGPVNLEKALAAGERLGGHLVTGHVDGVAEVMNRDGGLVTFRAPKDLARYIARKGSVAIDGVSLTVNRVDGGARFDVYLIPHTLAATTLERLQVGSRVNLEVDLVARYLERLVSERGD